MKTLAETLTKIIDKKLVKAEKIDLLDGTAGIAYNAGYNVALKEVKDLLDLYDAERKYWATK